jgi:uncharacterized damage-inducible protein DinB
MSGLKQLIIAEFNRRVFEESYTRIFKCLTLLDDDLVWKSVNPVTPPIGNLILHLCGNARQWILSGLGDLPDNRKRDEEFVVQKSIRKSDLIFLLENMKVNIKQTLADLEEGQLTKPLVIQGFHETGFSVLVHVIEHFSYHTGQITTLTKIHTNTPTGYYAGFDLNKLNKN